MATEALARRQPLWPSNVRRAELGAACELFGTDRTDAGLPRIDFRLCTERPGPVSWAHGFELTIASGLEAMDDVDLVVAVPSSTVPGSPATVGVQPSPAVTAARLRGQEYLLERRLCRRRSTGELIEHDRKSGTAWTRFAFPTWWHYDVLRGLEYFRCARVTPDERMKGAIELVESKCQEDGRWLLEVEYPGEMPVRIDDGECRASRWNTLRALRVLKWGSTRFASA